MNRHAKGSGQKDFRKLQPDMISQGKLGFLMRRQEILSKEPFIDLQFLQGNENLGTILLCKTQFLLISLASFEKSWCLE